MYYYIEVYDDRIEGSRYEPTDDWLESERVDFTVYSSWAEVINSGVFETGIPVHISPDLFSDAGIENTEWQSINNLYE